MAPAGMLRSLPLRIDYPCDCSSPALCAQGFFLAICGKNRVVNVFNRQGEEHAEIALDGSGKCTGLEWDKDGEMLAVMQEKSPVIKLWDANQNSESSLDTGVKEELTLICWSAAGPQLAIGTAKGEVSPMRASQQLRDHARCRRGDRQPPHLQQAHTQEAVHRRKARQDYHVRRVELGQQARPRLGRPAGDHLERRRRRACTDGAEGRGSNTKQLPARAGAQSLTNKKSLSNSVVLLGIGIILC